MDKYLVGSRYFFADEPDFNSKDFDYVRLVDNPVIFRDYRQLTGLGYCLFEWRRMSADKFVEYTLIHGPAMAIGKFLVPEFTQDIGFTVEHLKKLKPVVEKLDSAHQYEKIIFDSYIKNGKFELTHNQRKEAYKAYLQARSNKIEKIK